MESSYSTSSYSTSSASYETALGVNTRIPLEAPGQEEEPHRLEPSSSGWLLNVEDRLSLADSSERQRVQKIFDSSSDSSLQSDSASREEGGESPVNASTAGRRSEEELLHDTSPPRLKHTLSTIALRTPPIRRKRSTSGSHAKRAQSSGMLNNARRYDKASEKLNTGQRVAHVSAMVQEMCNTQQYFHLYRNKYGVSLPAEALHSPERPKKHGRRNLLPRTSTGRKPSHDLKMILEDIVAYLKKRPNPTVHQFPCVKIIDLPPQRKLIGESKELTELAQKIRILTTSDVDPSSRLDVFEATVRTQLQELCDDHTEKEAILPVLNEFIQQTRAYQKTLPSQEQRVYNRALAKVLLEIPHGVWSEEGFDELLMDPERKKARPLQGKSTAKVLQSLALPLIKTMIEYHLDNETADTLFREESPPLKLATAYMHRLPQYEPWIDGILSASSLKGLRATLKEVRKMPKAEDGYSYSEEAQLKAMRAAKNQLKAIAVSLELSCQATDKKRIPEDMKKFLRFLQKHVDERDLQNPTALPCGYTTLFLRIICPEFKARLGMGHQDIISGALQRMANNAEYIDGHEEAFMNPILKDKVLRGLNENAATSLLQEY